MKKSGQCPKCGSTEIIADAKAVDRGDADYERDMKVTTFREPKAILFKGRQSSTVSAWVCASCGFMELYADNPRKLVVPRKNQE